MEIKINLSYKGKTKSASLVGENIDNATMLKMVTSICTVLQEQLLSEAGPDEQGCMNWNISWKI